MILKVSKYLNILLTYVLCFLFLLSCSSAPNKIKKPSKVTTLNNISNTNNQQKLIKAEKTSKKSQTEKNQRGIVEVSKKETIPDAPGNLNEMIVFPKVIPLNQATEVTFKLKVDDVRVIKGNPKIERFIGSDNDRMEEIMEFAVDSSNKTTKNNEVWYIARKNFVEEKPDNLSFWAIAQNSIDCVRCEIVSPIATIEVRATTTKISGPFATRQGDRVIFRNSDDSIASVINLTPTKGNFSGINGNEITITHHDAIITQDQKHVGIVSFTSLEGDVSDDDQQNSYGSQFSFRNSSSELWSKSLPKGSFYYVPNENDGPDKMFSGNDGHILLVVFDQSKSGAKVQIYDFNGKMIREFISSVNHLVNLQISSYGNYVVLYGSLKKGSGYEFGYGYEAFNVITGAIKKIFDDDNLNCNTVAEGSDGKLKLWSNTDSSLCLEFF